MYCSDRKITKILQKQPLREKKMLKYTLIYIPCTTLTPPPPLWFTRLGRGTTAGVAGGRPGGWQAWQVAGTAGAASACVATGCAARPVLSHAGTVIGRARPITVTPPPAGTRAAPATRRGPYCPARSWPGRQHGGQRGRAPRPGCASRAGQGGRGGGRKRGRRGRIAPPPAGIFKI